jgi:hypothetical protein
MTGEAVRDANMTSDVRPAHCADMTGADGAHMGCADVTEVRAHSAELRGAHSEMRAAETADMGSAEATDMRSAETADMGSAEATDMRSADGPATEMRGAYSAETAATDMTAPAETAAKSAAPASVRGASRGKSEHDDCCCCSEKLRHDQPP